jgi:hypothetical protein
MRLAGAGVEICHRLHYLQMITEKLAKALLTPRGGDEPAPTTHMMFVQMLQSLKRRPEIQERLGYRTVSTFRNYIDSLLDLAGKIERLSPNLAGLSRPNPEYPWRDKAAKRVWAPAEFEFPELDSTQPRMLKMHRLVDDLLRLAR